MIIEVDGDIHFRQKKYDQYRDFIIHELGFQVIRVTNKMINEDIEFFFAKILTPILNNKENKL